MTCGARRAKTRPGFAPFCSRRDLRGLQAGAEGPGVPARRLSRRRRRALRRVVRARAVRAPRRVGRALGGGARVDHANRGVRRRAQPQLPPRGRLSAEGEAEGGT